ncbi:hypothetical protein AAC691_12990 [Nguyenibacter vanlangensis]|uniref:TubC N-terminal docking domain-containing protein n=1 Tax=Nguyenibacter vanlangensis TaxID=1216886 RepID=A0ABZ3D0E8_9PROT
MVSQNLLRWASDPATADPMTDTGQVAPLPSANSIDLAAVTDDERRSALRGPAQALLTEAEHYGVRVLVDAGRPRLSGKLPPEAIEAEFPQRLALCRREVAIAADSLARGWRVAWSEDEGIFRVMSPREAERIDITPFLVEARSNLRSPSWVDLDGIPVPDGTACHCCRGTTWWREAEHPQGWRCRNCHPAPLNIPIITSEPSHPTKKERA